MSELVMYSEESVFFKQEWKVNKKRDKEGEMTLKDGKGKVTDSDETGSKYYWIEDKETGRIFQAPDFPTAEEILLKASEKEEPLKFLESHDKLDERNDRADVFINPTF